MDKDMANGVKNNTASRSAQRRQREREFRYQTILHAAETLFAGEGYQGASMERIAEEAEVAVGTVYFYFKNKEDLLVHLLDNIAFHLREMVGSEFTQAKGSLSGFERAGMAFFEDFCPRNPEKIAIMFRESVGKGPLVESRRKEIFDKFTEDVQGALVRLAENLGWRYKSKTSAETIAVSIVGMYERIAYQYLIWQDQSKKMGAVARDALAFIMGGIQNLGEIS